ncbi:MAG: periplasmic heavy metal sensor [Deltaproteobacteria bacterium]|nr:periplasmic heavy metal sensor [Deltaproteobacteria bacterium]
MAGKNYRVILLLFCFVLITQAAPAQGPPEKRGWEDRGGRGMMMGPMHTPMMDWAGQLDLTPEQAAKIQELRESYLRDTLPSRNELIVKRFDLRDLLRNPQAEPQVILGKQREISDLEAKIQERGLLLHIEMRKILTPQQIKLLPLHWGGMPGSPGMPGWGRGMGREY